MHLESVVEDALDISRLENNKFQINYELFDVRKTCTEIAEIMKFQIDQKGLEMRVNIARGVPETINSD